MDPAPSEPQASKEEIRRAKAKQNAKRQRMKKKREKIYTEARIQAALSTRLLEESRLRCIFSHWYQAFVGDGKLLEMLHQRRVRYDAENARVKLQLQDAIAHIDRSQCNFLVPPSRLTLSLHRVQLLPRAPVDIETCRELANLACEELANFVPSRGERTHFVPFQGWKINVWNSGDCNVSVKGSLAVNWNPEMAMYTTWEILTSPSRSLGILLDIPTDEVMQVQQFLSGDLAVVQRLVQPPPGLCSESREPREFVSVLFRRHIGSTFLVGMKSLPTTTQAGYSYPMHLRGQELRGWMFTAELDQNLPTPVMAEVVSSVSFRCPFDRKVLTGLANVAIHSTIEWEHKITQS